METSFGFISSVKDEHFQEVLAAKLLKGCMSIEALEENPDDAISLMRRYHEMVIQYLRERLIGKTGPADRMTVSQVLGNSDFRHKIGNEIFIDIAYKVQKFGNMAVHSDTPDNENYDPELNRTALLDMFITEIKTACILIDKLPPVKKPKAAAPQAKDVDRLTGGVAVHITREKNEKGETERYLVAEIKGTQSLLQDLIYVWKDGETKRILQRGEENRFQLPLRPDGKKYTCVVISNSIDGRLESRICMDNPAKSKQKSRVADSPTSEANREHASQKHTQFPLVTPISDVVAPMKWPSSTPKLFDSSSGLTHYFVRPNDSFVLNTLELLDADAYLYRLLKQEGYENITFVEVKSTECRIYAYDAQSESVFKAKSAAEKKGPQGTFGVKVNRAETKAAPTPALGRRCIRKFSRGEEFIKQFAAEIGQALRNPSQKTAIVMPMSIFGKEGYCGEPVIDTLNDIAKTGNYGNILLLTMPRRGEIIECFENNKPRLHSAWASNVLNAMRTANIDIVQESIQQLLELGRIVLADGYQVDEIANLLLRKKIILNMPEYRKIPSTKIYSLAELLLAHCMQEREEFKSIPFIKRREHCIRQLNSLLDSPDVAAELNECSKKLQNVQTGFSKQVSSLQLARVYHQFIMRYKDCSVEEEILKEFDTYVGNEMASVKESILTAVRVFEDERQLVQREIDAGRQVKPDDWPCVNFRFVGPPGSGKTSIAGITARYLNARGILPTSKVITVNATQLIRSHVGETAQLLREAADRADGGVLIIDEFHGFESAYQGGNVAQDAMRAIVQIVNEKRNSLCIIAAGYEADVERVFKFDDGADRRFPHTVEFKNYSSDSLMSILDSVLEKRGRSIAPEARPLVKRVIESDIAVKGDHFGNAGYLKDTLVPQLTASLLKSEENRNIFTADDVLSAFPDKRNILLKTDKSAEEVLREFDSYVGPEMESIKAEIIASVNMFAGLRERQSYAPVEPGERIYPYMNMKFVGPPGTGKTTVAKLTAKYMNALGILPRDSVEMINATELIRSEVGGTANLIREAADRANGGILIIDEFHGFDNAYQGGNIAKDATNAITAVLNKYGDTLCVIAAGYESGVEKVLKMDDGLPRRFPFSIHFTSYSVPTLLTIFDSVLKKRGMQIEPQAKERLTPVIGHDKKTQGASFGNAGYLSDYLFSALAKQAFSRDPKADTIKEEDVIRAFPDRILSSSAVDAPKASPSAQAEAKHSRTEYLYQKLRREEFERLLPPYPLSGHSQKELGKLVDPSILFISSDQGSGTAFLIHPDGYAVTCRHVVDGATQMRASLFNQEETLEYNLAVVNSKADLDLALIKLVPRHEGETFPYLPLAGKDEAIEKDEAIVLYGFPMGEKLASDISHDPGTIKSINHIDPSGIEYIALSLQAKGGNSGSPVVAMQSGKVLGVLLGSLTQTAQDGRIEEVDCFRPIHYLWSEFFK